MTYSLVDLKLFVAIADAGNMARGAERCFLAPSSASLRIKQLEASLDTSLFLRGPRGISLTRAGQVMLAHCRRCLAELEEMHANLAPFAGGAKGQVTLLANSSAIASHLPDDLAAFLVNHPLARVSLEEHVSSDIVAAVAAGRADLGIVTWAEGHPELSFWPYHNDRAVVIAPLGAPLGHRGQAKFIECLDHPFVSLASGAAIHAFMSGKAATLGRTLDVRVQVASFSTVISLVRAGAGIAIVPLSVMGDKMDGGLKVLELNEPWAKRRLDLCVRKDEGVLSGYARELFRQLRSRAEQRELRTVPG